MKWLRQLFCKHEWVTRFRGSFTRGVECKLCGKAKLLYDYNDGTEQTGWIDE